MLYFQKVAHKLKEAYNTFCRGFHCLQNMGGSPGDVVEVPVTWVERRKGWRMSCDVGEATQGMGNKL